MRRTLFGVLAAVTIAAPIALTAAPAQAAVTVPTITRFNHNPDTFYPTVRDGFRDTVTFTAHAANLVDEFGDPVSQTWNINIYNADGHRVASTAGTVREWRDIRWTWNTKNQRTGNPVPTGRYKAVLDVVNDDNGDGDTMTSALWAKTDTVNKRITKSRTGVQTSSRWRRGDCQVTRDGWLDGPSSLYLDCRGGKTGANYGFVLPRNATNVAWAMRGSHGFGWDGRIIKTGKRVTPTRFRVGVTVTGWEAYSIKRANVTYTTKVKR
jgi:hypothetical protein